MNRILAYVPHARHRTGPAVGRRRPTRLGVPGRELAALAAGIAGLTALAAVGLAPAAQASQASPGRQDGHGPVASRVSHDQLARQARAGSLRRLWRPAGLGQDSWQPAGTWRPGAVGRASATASRWRTEPAPSLVRQRNGTLLAGSCTSPAACTAVGSYWNGGGITVPLAERWNGTRWSIQAVPVPAGAAWARLFGVSCAAAADCVAVGYYYGRAGQPVPLAERWNGTRWNIVAIGVPAGAQAAGFFAVSCPSATACTAVGEVVPSLGKPGPLAERWNGTRWTVQVTASPADALASGVFGVSCPTASDCVAAGSSASVSGSTQILAEAWHGAAWAIQAAPAPAGATGAALAAVSCTSARACTGAGSYTGAGGSSRGLAERWNGRRWRIQAVASPAGASGSELLAVWCTSATACTAVGSFVGSGPAVRARRPVSPASGGSLTILAETWNGTSWQVQPALSPVGASGSELDAVWCASPGACAAAGSYARTADPAGLTLADGWTGSRWSVQATPNPVGAADSELRAVSCPERSACIAVGSASTATRTVPLAESWNGTRWRIVPIPNPAGSTGSTLFGVSCATARACTAVGYANTRPGTSLAIAEAWTGSRWRPESVPDPAGASSSSLYGVSCAAAGACTAVGSYTKGSGLPQSLAEHWNGTRWAIQQVPRPAGSKAPRLQAVSCVSARSCTAVGYAALGGDAQPLAEHWNGRRWAVGVTALPTGAAGGAFGGVSCTAARACTATGTLFGSGTLADRWNGTVWRIQNTPNPPGFTSSFSEVSLSAVACASAVACTAIGNYTPGNVPTAFAESWHGTAWTEQAAATPPGTTASYLGGVACTATTCTAAGADTGLSGVIVPLVMTAPA